MDFCDKMGLALNNAENIKYTAKYLLDVMDLRSKSDLLYYWTVTFLTRQIAVLGTLSFQNGVVLKNSIVELETKKQTFFNNLRPL